MIYWFTGQPGSGKTVLADLLKEKFLPHAYRIDGDEMRDLFQNKDYSMNGRIKNIDAAQKIAHYRDQREEFKSILDWQIKEFFVHYDISKVKRGREDYHVLGYQPPTHDYIGINTTKDNEMESLVNIASKLKL